MLNLLFYFSLFALSLGQFSAIYKTGESNIYVFDAVVAFFALTGNLFFLINKSYRIPKLLAPFLVFTMWAAVTLFLNMYWLDLFETSVSMFYLLRLAIYFFAGISVYNMLDKSLITEHQLIKSVIFSGVLISLLGFVQLLVLPDFEKLDPQLGWDPHKNRLASTFFDPNFVGGYLNLCLALGIVYLTVKDKKISTLVLISLLVVIAVAIFLTFSRSAWGMAAVIILILGIFKSRALLITALLLAFLAYFAIPRVQTRISGVTDPSDSAHFRLISWQNAMSIAEDNLLYGVGFNTFRYAQRNYGIFDVGETGGNAGAGTDSSFLLILSTTGVIGFLLFLVSYFYSAFQALVRKNSYSLVLLASFMGLLLQSQFINALFYPQILFLWVAVLVLFNYSSSRT